MAARRTERRAAGGPWLLVAAAVAWNLVNLRATTVAVAYLDDSSVHNQMVRFATAQLRAGDLPLTSWFPYLGLGSPQFLHYQSLTAMLTGVVGLVTGPNVARIAFRYRGFRSYPELCALGGVTLLALLASGRRPLSRPST